MAFAEMLPKSEREYLVEIKCDSGFNRILMFDVLSEIDQIMVEYAAHDFESFVDDQRLQFESGDLPERRDLGAEIDYFLGRSAYGGDEACEFARKLKEIENWKRNVTFYNITSIESGSIIVSIVFGVASVASGFALAELRRGFGDGIARHELEKLGKHISNAIGILIHPVNQKLEARIKKLADARNIDIEAHLKEENRGDE